MSASKVAWDQGGGKDKYSFLPLGTWWYSMLGRIWTVKAVVGDLTGSYGSRSYGCVHCMGCWSFEESYLVHPTS